jgi:hypothetical protein
VVADASAAPFDRVHGHWPRDVAALEGLGLQMSGPVDELPHPARTREDAVDAFNHGGDRFRLTLVSSGDTLHGAR